MKPSIVVVGSSNTDMVIQSDHLPAPGETILGGTFLMTQGGKGANQAVAAARLNGQVTFIAKVGADIFGEKSLQLYKIDGIDTSYITAAAGLPSGVALINVDSNGENCIAVAPGANAALSVADTNKSAEVFRNAAIILIQLEIPLETVQQVVKLAKQHNVKVILNPAPARALPDELMTGLSIITPNKKEAEMLTGIEIHDDNSAKEAAEKLAAKGIKTVIITMGSQGALIFDEDTFTSIPAIKVKAADTTAAGDVFNGALAVAISEGKNITQAVSFANAAAAISVTKAGAQASAPNRSEVEELMNSAKIKV